ncbi:Rhodanese-like domain-containing protein [Hyaloraphidium curvatum]|nr:Rhodanese-like domain-containing protein [Hyaloraphidium curvatum]
MGAGDQHHHEGPDDTPERFPDLKFVEPAELAAWLKKKDGKLRVVDVRADEYSEKHIVGAVHIPSDEIQNDPSPAVEQLKSEQTLVFHCGFSRNRGPKAAKKVRDALKAAGINGPEIYVLKGGWDAFEKQFGSGELVE